MPPRTIAIANNKGGVGKTHTAFHLAGAYAEAGKRVLLIDLDGQGNLTKLFAGERELQPNAYDVLVDDVPINRAIGNTHVAGVDLVPSDARLYTLDAVLHGKPDAEVRLDDALKELVVPFNEQPYDRVILDCPPALNLCNHNALVAAERVVVPLQADKFPLEGLDALLDLINAVKATRNPKLDVAGILISLYMPRRGIQQSFEASTRRVGREAGFRVFDVAIKNAASYQEAIANRQPITHYKPRSEFASAFRRLLAELDQRQSNGFKCVCGLLDRRSGRHVWGNPLDSPALSPTASSVSRRIEVRLATRGGNPPWHESDSERDSQFGLRFRSSLGWRNLDSVVESLKLKVAVLRRNLETACTRKRPCGRIERVRADNRPRESGDYSSLGGIIAGRTSMQEWS